MASIKILILVLFTLPFVTCGQRQVSHDSISHTIDLAINYLEQNQEKETIEGLKYKGEWPVYKDLTAYFVFLGKKQKARDSNCFTVSAVHNFLGELYLLDSSYKQVLPLLQNAYKEIETYRAEAGAYNFWKLLPPQRKLKYFNNPDSLVLVRRPTNFILRNKFIHKTAHIPNDADDTALGNTARHIQNQIFGSQYKLVEPTLFDKYIDTLRQNKNWYNYFFLGKEDSHGYMTWLYPEHEYKRFNRLKMSLNTILLFVPGSSAFPKAYEPWVPFGANEVDFVVNANILSYLAATHQLQKSANASRSIRLLNALESFENPWSESVYYANSYHMIYALAKAAANGVALDPKLLARLIRDLENYQNKDGSYSSSRYVNNEDCLQGTAYALHAMEDLVGLGYKVKAETRKKALSYILSHAVVEQHECHWPGGVFFTGGTVLRNVLYWKSDAYTTALVSLSLKKYLLNNSQN